MGISAINNAVIVALLVAMFQGQAVADSLRRSALAVSDYFGSMSKSPELHHSMASGSERQASAFNNQGGGNSYLSYISGYTASIAPHSSFHKLTSSSSISSHASQVITRPLSYESRSASWYSSYMSRSTAALSSYSSKSSINYLTMIASGYAPSLSIKNSDVYSSSQSAVSTAVQIMHSQMKISASWYISTMLPSLVPTESPTILPTVTPSFVPTESPTILPTVTPSFVPTKSPTFVPTESPTLAPTQSPTPNPTQSEESQWADVFDEFSNGIAKNYSNYYQEIRLRDTLVQGSCKDFNSFTSSVLLYSSLTENINSLSLYDKSGLSSTAFARTVNCDKKAAIDSIIGAITSGTQSSVSCNSETWYVKQCAGSPAICVNCTDPCDPNSFCAPYSFAINPCAAASGDNSICNGVGSTTWGVGHFRSMLYSSSPLAKPPLFSHVAHVATNKSMSALVLLAGNGSISCSLYPSSYELLFVDSIRLHGVKGKIATSSSDFSPFNTNGDDSLTYSRIVTFNDIKPSTSYSMYCFTVGEFGSPMALVDVLDRRLDFASKCCKVIEVSMQQKEVRSGADAINTVSISIRNLPSANLTLHLSTVCSNQPSGYCPMIPSSVFIDGQFSETKIMASLTSMSTSINEANVVIKISLTGPSAGEFFVNYQEDANFFKLIGSTESPSAPLLSNALFSDDGSYVLVSFDSKTDEGGSAISNKRSFLCSSLFVFYEKASSVKIAPNAVCSWLGLDTVIVYSNHVNIGDSIAAASGVVRSECKYSKAGDLACDQYNSTTSSATVVIRPPLKQLLPSISLIGPTLSSVCDVLVLDVSGSTGSGGRAWKSLEVSVIGPVEVVGNLTKFISSDFYTSKISPPVPIPPALLQQGNYEFTFTLCNFLDNCGSGSINTLIVNNVVPTLSIIGSKLRTITASTVLALDSYAYTASCTDGSRSKLNLQYSWTVSGFNNGVAVKDASLVSSSKEHNLFKLSPYSLLPGSLYEINLIVYSTVSKQSSFSSVRVFVQAQAIVAVIAGGAVTGLKDGGSTPLVLDASGSFDMDSIDGQPTSTFMYSWSCIQTQPVLISSCDSALILSSTTDSELEISTFAISSDNNAPSSSGVVAVVTVIVSDSMRRSQASVTVVVQDIAAPEVKIASLTTRKHNVDEKIKLAGAVRAATDITGSCKWTLDDATVDLNSQLLTNQLVPFASVNDVDWIPINFALREFSLQPRAVYNFALTCTSSKPSESIITIVMNGPPMPGLFIVEPVEGVELNTTFSLSASLWQDDDLPISYLFGFVDANSQIEQVVKSRSELSYTSTLLPAGAKLNEDGEEWKLDCMIRVFDNYDSDSLALFSVKVTKQIMSTSELASFATNMFNSAGSTSDIKSALSLVSSVVNQVNCSLVSDDYCSNTLNRNPCNSVPNTCGSCLTSYVGISGYSNRPCISGAQQGARRLLAGEVKSCPQDCTADEDHGTCAHFDEYSGLPVNSSDCTVDTTSCVAVCVCKEKYGGSNCYFTKDELLEKATLREELIFNLLNLVKDEDASKDSVSNQVATLQSLTDMSRDEISTESALDVLVISDLIFAISKSYGITIQFEPVLTAIDISVDTLGSRMSRMIASYLNQRRALTSSAASESYVETVAYLAQSASGLISSEMVLGQANIDYILQNFRISASAQARSSGQSTTLRGITPTVQAEVGRNQSISIVVPAYQSASSDVKMATISIDSIQFQSHELGNATSSPMIVYFGNANNICSGAGCKMRVRIVHNVPQAYMITSDAIPMLTSQIYCEYNDNVRYNVSYNCPDLFDTEISSPLNQDVTVSCNGYYDYNVSVTCPYKLRRPTCSRLASISADGNLVFSDNVCNVTAYSDKVTECECNILSSDFVSFSLGAASAAASSNRRVLLSSDGGQSFMVAGVAQSEYHASSLTILPHEPSTVSFDVSFTITLAGISSLDNAAKQTIKTAVADTMEVDVDSIEFKSSSSSSSTSSMSGRKLLISNAFAVILGVTLSSASYPPFTNSMNSLYSQKSSMLSSAFGNNNFINNFNAAAANIVGAPQALSASALSVSSPVIVGAPTMAPTVAPTSAPVNKGSSSANAKVIMWSLIGVAAAICLLASSYYAYKKYSIVKDKPAIRLSHPVGHVNPAGSASAEIESDVEVGMDGFGVDNTSIADLGFEVSMDEPSAPGPSARIAPPDSPTYDINNLNKATPLVGMFKFDLGPNAGEINLDSEDNQGKGGHVAGEGIKHFTHHTHSKDDKKITAIDHSTIQNANKAFAMRVIGQVTALYSYSPMNDDELMFNIGDIIDVLEHNPSDEEIDEGWNIGRRLADGTHGLFPTNYTTSYDKSKIRSVDNSTIISSIKSAIESNNTSPVAPSSNRGDNKDSVYEPQGIKHLPTLKLPPLQMSNSSSKFQSSVVSNNSPLNSNSNSSLLAAPSFKGVKSVTSPKSQLELSPQAAPDLTFPSTIGQKLKGAINATMFATSNSSFDDFSPVSPKSNLSKSNSFAQPLNLPNKISNALPSSPKKKGGGISDIKKQLFPIQKARALYDYVPQHDDELAFKTGDIIELVTKGKHGNGDGESSDDDGWSRGRINGGSVGLFPLNYVKLLPLEMYPDSNTTESAAWGNDNASTSLYQGSLASAVDARSVLLGSNVSGGGGNSEEAKNRLTKTSADRYSVNL